MESMFPIMVERGNKAWVPWRVVKDLEDMAQRNHSQSISRLAERGGLDARELASLILKKRWKDTDGTVKDAWRVIWNHAFDDLESESE